MIEEWKEIDFSIFKKSNDYNKSKYFVSNLGNILKDEKPVKPIIKKNNRKVFKYAYKEIGIAACVSCAFIDKEYKHYNIKFKDNNPLNCELLNIELEYLHRHREKKPETVKKYVDFINEPRCKRIFYSYIYRKSIHESNMFSKEDFYQEYLLWTYEHLNFVNNDNYKGNIELYMTGELRNWYSKLCIRKTRAERLKQISVDQFNRTDNNKILGLFY